MSEYRGQHLFKHLLKVFLFVRLQKSLAFKPFTLMLRYASVNGSLLCMFLQQLSGAKEIEKKKITNATTAGRVLICVFEYKQQGGTDNGTGKLTSYTFI